MVKVRTRKRRRATSVSLDYYDSDGRRIQTVVGRATTAAELASLQKKAAGKAEKIEEDLRAGIHVARARGKSIDVALFEFDEFLKSCIASGNVKESTRRHYDDTITRFRSYLATTRARRVKDVKPALIVGFTNSMRGCANNTISGHLTRVKRIFSRLVENGEIATNPFKHPDVKAVWPPNEKHERAFTADEVDVLLGATLATRSPFAGDYRDFFRLLAETGMRLGECLMLRYCDCNLTNDAGAFVRVEPHDGWAPKTASSVRTIPLSPACVAMLRDRLQRAENPNVRARVFPLTFTNRSVNQMLNRALSRVGLDAVDQRGQKLTVHSLRHGYATRLVQSGADPVTVRDLLGHESITTTNRYFNMPRSQLFGAVATAFGAAAGKKRATESSKFQRFPAENRG